MPDPALLVGTADGIFELNGGRRTELAGHEISAMASENGCRWAVLDGRRVQCAPADGEWRTAGELNGDPARCLAVTPSGVLIGTARAGLYRVGSGWLERVEPFDRVEGRDEWYTPWGGPPDTRSLSAGPTGALFANIHVGGVVRSMDGGRRWEPTMDIESDCHQVLAHPDDDSVVLAACAIGLGVSTDGGRHWRFRTAGLHATYQRAVAISGDRLLVSASQNERGREAAVYRGSLAGGRLVRCTAGLPEWFADNVNTHCLVARQTYAALGTSDGQVYLSRDLGETWEQLAEGLPKVRAVQFR